MMNGRDALRGLAADKPRPYYEYGFENEKDVPYKWTEFAKFVSFNH